MTQDEREGFFADEPVEFGGAHSDRDGSEQPKPYPDAIRSFVGTVQHLAAVERERDEARAEVERLRAAADRLRDGRDELLYRGDQWKARAEKCEAALARVREVVIEHWPEIPGDAIFEALDDKGGDDE